MSVRAVMRTVRSFAPPDPAAALLVGGHVVRIIGAVQATATLPTAEVQRLEPGRVVAVEGTMTALKADDGLVTLECRPPLPPGLVRGTCIHPPTAYWAKWHDVLNAA